MAAPYGDTIFTFTPRPAGRGELPAVQFRALISSISDNYTPDWGSHMDMGRAEPKFMYNRYSRTISVDFMTAALATGEEKEWLKVLNSLSEMTKPVYNGTLGFNGVFCKMIIGKYINTIGYIANLSYDVDNDSPWDNDIPIYISCSITLQVIGDKKPSFKANKSHNPGGFANSVKSPQAAFPRV